MSIIPEDQKLLVHYLRDQELWVHYLKGQDPRVLGYYSYRGFLTPGTSDAMIYIACVTGVVSSKIPYHGFRWNFSILTELNYEIPLVQNFARIVFDGEMVTSHRSHS